ncbi:uncharacterized protein LOC113561658 [Ooceraea biroi]|uniref:uncharacterized protein LOC113561658 n=1 Tax=Ooceraea biroi TaxID=2015173 RepID=UPI000F085FFD|nr:uncharacterized protein LOC113561658 [Ooceraea biroi]
MTRENWRNVADGFYKQWDFPNCIGAFDGKHIRIQAPKNSERDEAFPLKTYLLRPYSKPKKRYQQNQASAAEISATLETDENINNNYETTENMHQHNISEFPGLTSLSLSQRVFNYRLSRVRRVIENAFGILVSKWAILKGTLCCKVDNAVSIVMTIICLYNFLLESEIDISPLQRLYQNVGLVDRDGSYGESLQN